MKKILAEIKKLEAAINFNDVNSYGDGSNMEHLQAAIAKILEPDREYMDMSEDTRKKMLAIMNVFSDYTVEPKIVWTDKNKKREIK